MPHRRAGRYQVVVKNRPAELAKLTGLLVRRGVKFKDLTIATVGDTALVRFSTTAS